MFSIDLCIIYQTSTCDKITHLKMYNKSNKKLYLCEKTRCWKAFPTLFKDRARLSNYKSQIKMEVNHTKSFMLRMEVNITLFILFY